MDALFMENHTNLMLEGTFQIPSLTRPLNPRQFPPCPRAHSQWQNWDSNPLFQALHSVLLFCTMWTSHMPGQREALCYSHHMWPFQGNFSQLRRGGQGSSLTTIPEEGEVSLVGTEIKVSHHEQY